MSRAEQSRAEQSRAEQSRAEQSRAEAWRIHSNGKTYRYMPIVHYVAFYYIDNNEVYVARILNYKQNWVKLFHK